MIRIVIILFIIYIYIFRKGDLILLRKQIEDKLDYVGPNVYVYVYDVYFNK